MTEALQSEVPTDNPSSARSTPKVYVWLGIVSTLVVVAATVMALSGSQKASVADDDDMPRMESGRLVYSESFKKRARLASAEAREAALVPVVSAVGTVRFNPRYVASVGTRLRGVVRSVEAYEGDEVKAGQVVAKIDSPELAEAQAQVATLEAQAQAAAVHAARETSLEAQHLSTARVAESARAEERGYNSMLRAAEQKLEALAGSKRRATAGAHVLKAPLAGTIVERSLTQGELVEGDEVAFVVADLDRLWVELDVFEQKLSAIRVGDSVVVKPLNDAALPLEGRVAHVGSMIDQRTRSARVRIEVDNAAGSLRPGQMVDAKIRVRSQAGEAVTLIPAKAVTHVDGKPTVFVEVAPDAVVPTVVSLGETDGTEQQITRGLNPGDRVVVSGVFALKSELFR